MIFNMTLCIISVIFEPRGFAFTGQLVLEKYFYFPVVVFVKIYHVDATSAGGCSVAYVGCGALLYCFYVTIITTELRIGRRRYKSEDTLRMLRNIKHAYRCLQVFHANDLSGWTLFGRVQCYLLDVNDLCQLCFDAILG